MITDLASLETAIGNWLHRSDMAGVVDDLIMLAEKRINADVKSRHQDDIVTLTTTAGVNTVAIPDDMIDVRRLRVMTDPVVVLKYLAPDQMAVTYTLSYSSVPRHFTVIGSNLELAPVPDAAYNIELTYVQAVPALSSTNTTNWLLTNHPNVYLFAALVEAQAYIVDDQRIAVWDQKYREALAGVNRVDWYSGSTPRISVM
jgi:hypothetical protein